MVSLLSRSTNFPLHAGRPKLFPPANPRLQSLRSTRTEGCCRNTSAEVVSGTIFHDDHLEARIGDLPQRGETIAQHLRTVVVHDQDGNLRPFVRGNFFLSWRRHNVRGFVEKYLVKAAGRTFPEFQPYSISKSSSAIMVAGCWAHPYTTPQPPPRVEGWGEGI